MDIKTQERSGRDGEVVVAEPADAAAMFAVIRASVADMRSRGIFQWNDSYPTRGIVEADARAGTLYVCRGDGVVVAGMCLNSVQSPEWSSMPWRDAEGSALVVHRVCVHPAWQRQGLARRLMDFAEGFGVARGFTSIRLDANLGNEGALALYEQRGYRRVGRVTFPDRPLPFACFEKPCV